MTETEFRALVIAGRTVEALSDAPFSYVSSLSVTGYTFRIDGGRVGYAPSLDEAILRALAASAVPNGPATPREPMNTQSEN